MTLLSIRIPRLWILNKQKSGKIVKQEKQYLTRIYFFVSTGFILCVYVCIVLMIKR